MLAFPILLHVVVGGAAIGTVAARPFGWKVLVYAVVGIVGALLSFCDAPFLMRYPYLNPFECFNRFQRLSCPTYA